MFLSDVHANLPGFWVQKQETAQLETGTSNVNLYFQACFVCMTYLFFARICNKYMYILRRGRTGLEYSTIGAGLQ